MFLICIKDNVSMKFNLDEDLMKYNMSTILYSFVIE